MKPLIGFLSLTLMLGAVAGGQTRLTLSGTVLEKGTGRPLEGARVAVIGGAANTEITDSNGIFILKFPSDVHSGDPVHLHIEKQGYASFTTTVAVSPSLPTPIFLEGIKNTPKSHAVIPKNPDTSKQKNADIPKVHPLIKQDAFSTLIPFITEESLGMLSGASIPSDSNFNGPLHLMYSEIGGISSISLMPEVDQQSGAYKAPNLTDVDMRNFLGHVLQYYILRAISEMQHTITAMNYETGKGATTVTTSAVIVPDETEYPRNDLDKLLATAKIPIWPGGMWVWKRYPLKVPKGATVSFSEASEGEKIFYIVRFVRAPDFRLDFKIESAGRNQGQGAFPKYFVPMQPNRIKNAYTYIFVINLNFQWNGDHMDGEPYVDWAQGLFSGLRKKLVIPN
jgi:hypothetical protein